MKCPSKHILVITQKGTLRKHEKYANSDETHPSVTGKLY